jgi:DnaJ-class molecular chaperone
MFEKKLISEYEAAAMTAMSPELLRWLTKHAPKQGIGRKLKIGEVKKGTHFYEEEDLRSFNNWLKLPWPRKDGKRPHIPSAVRKEIKNEANGECAICNSHKDTCEAAHLDPVSKSDNNHPENLLWLCSNHHTAYDNGLFGPDDENAEFVIGFKQVLRRYKVMLWRMQHELSHKVFVALENCDGLLKQLEAAQTKSQIKAVEKLAEKTLAAIPAMSPVSKADPKYGAYQSISADIVALGKSTSNVSVRLQKAKQVRREYIAAYGFIACPLCKATGRHEGTDCPVCNGDREIEKRYAGRIDLSEYEKIDCPLCSGGGQFEGEQCPACGGDAQMDRRYAEAIDIRDYQKVECPLCEGSAKYLGADCPVCDGYGEIDRRYAAQVDLREYDEVDCLLCRGTGSREGGDCPECGGEGQLQRRYADQADLRDYSKVDCPVCDGKGTRNGGDCPACGGEAQIDRRDLDRIDVRDYQIIKCPICKGKGARQGSDCHACGGEGEMERRHAENLDQSGSN